MAEERRLVTVLFADVTGSTALGEALDPEDVRALLGRYYAIARDVIAAHGGTLEKFIGDAVMAVFGLPIAHGDDAQRALAAALELRRRVRAEPQLRDRLPIRIGISTGEVVATRDTSAGDFLITGDAVNVAARLQQHAEPWTILASERTARAAPGATYGEAIGIEAKGKRAPLRAHPVRAAGARARPRMPLLGRDADLAQLELAARRAFGERRPFLVSVIAPAGTGKTRLLEEFLDRLPQHAPHATVAVAQCLPYGQRLTYWPLRAVLFGLVGIPDDATPEAVRDAVRAWALDTGLEQPQRVADLLAATVGAGETDVTDREALFAAWRAAIEAAARRRPLVMVFEDLHWSSDSLLDLVEFVMQPRSDAPLLMIALSRPELLDRRPVWGGGRRNYVSIALEPLADDAVAALVHHLLGRPSPAIVARVVARAEGNPFYAGEIVRAIADRVASLDDEPAIERALATLPDTVQATVLARLDLLEPGERRVLQLGAVFGRAFRASGVAALAPDLGDVGALTDRLLDKDLIRREAGDRHVFRHILIREVAYATLPRAERARLHAAAGQTLEERAAGREDELAELVAYHYREAATLAASLNVEDVETAPLRAKAAAWLGRAASVALAGAATREATAHLRGAIEFARPEERAALYVRIGDINWGNAGVEAYRAALRLHTEHGSSADERLRALAGLLTLYTRWQGTVNPRPSRDEVEALRAEGRALASQATDQRAQGRFLMAETFYPFWRRVGGGDVTAAELEAASRSAEQGLAIARALDDAQLQSAVLDGIGALAQERGDWHGNRESARQRIAIEERLDLIERTDAYAMAAWASVLLGDLDEAERSAAAGLALLRPGQLLTGALHLAAWRAYALALLGRWDEVVSLGDRTIQLYEEVAIPGYTASLRAFLAAFDVARARRDAPRMARHRAIVERIASHVDPTIVTGRLGAYVALDLDAVEQGIVARFDRSHSHVPEYVERALSLCADHRRRVPEPLVRSVLEFAAEGRMAMLEAQAHRALGVALDDPAEFAHALEIFEARGAVPYAARARCERALLTGDETDVAAGVRVLEDLGDLEYLAALERARRRGA